MASRWVLRILCNIELRAGLIVIWSWHVRNLLSLTQNRPLTEKEMYIQLPIICPYFTFPLNENTYLALAHAPSMISDFYAIGAQLENVKCLYRWLMMLLPMACSHSSGEMLLPLTFTEGHQWHSGTNRGKVADGPWAPCFPRVVFQWSDKISCHHQGTLFIFLAHSSSIRFNLFRSSEPGNHLYGVWKNLWFQN